MKYSALEGNGNQYWPMHSSILAWRSPLKRRLASHSPHGCKELDMTKATLNAQTQDWVFFFVLFCFVLFCFLPLAALPQQRLTMKVAKLLESQGSWWCQVCKYMDCLNHRSYGPIRILSRASCTGDQKPSLASLSLQLSPFNHLEGSLAQGPSPLSGTSGTQMVPLGWDPTLQIGTSST